MATANNSECYLFRGVELDSNYDNVLIPLGSTAARANYFLDSNRYPNRTHFINLSYIRPEQGKIRVNGAITAADYNSNYVMFRNQSHENKWFYAFVNRVEYVSDNAFDVLFDLDPINTYMEQLELKASHIIRAHQDTDNFGDNVEIEPFAPNIKTRGSRIIGCNEADVAYYIYAEKPYLPNTPVAEFVQRMSFDHWGVYRFYNEYLTNMDWSGANPPEMSCVMGGYFALWPATIRGLNGFLSEFAHYYNAGTYDRIIKMGMMPNIGRTFDVEDGDRVLDFNGGKLITAPSFLMPDDIDGYTPHNKKCYTSQFNYIEMVGDNVEDLYFELSKNADHSIKLEGYGSFMCYKPSLFVVPKAYDMTHAYSTTPQWDGAGATVTSGNTPGAAANHAVFFTNYPEFAFAIDGQRDYSSAQATAERISGAIAGLVGGNGGGRTFEPRQMRTQGSPGPLDTSKNVTVSGVGAGYGAIIQYAAGEVAGAISAKGKTIGTPIQSMPQQMFTMGVTVRYKQAMRSQIEKIDSFFDRYGYAINKCAIPNINARQYFTYIQLQNPDIGGDMPEDARRVFSEVLSRGTTFFNTNGRIGTYRPANQNTPNN